jgi:hypothetical protein
MNYLQHWFELKLSTWSGIADLFVLAVLILALIFEGLLLARITDLLHEFSKHKNSG